MDKERLIQVVKHFLSSEAIESVRIKAIESGLINSTFKVQCSKGEYILQQVNTGVFPNPNSIQKNISSVENHLKDSDYSKEVLSIHRTLNHELMHKRTDGSIWRMFKYIPQSCHHHVVPSVEHAFEAARALGEFHQYLSTFDSSALKTPIQGFLDFQARINHFDLAIKNGDQLRKNQARNTIQFIEDHGFILDEYKQIEASLPKRVIHGDPKISNFLFKEHSTEVLCLIDWDTIMQGSVLYDFGDMTRSFTNRKEESDSSSTPVFNEEIFSAIKEGYLVHQGEALTDIELDNLLLGAKTVIYIQAIRFLTDYLNKDVYFKTSYADQNLDRTINQIQLLGALLKFET